MILLDKDRKPLWIFNSKETPERSKELEIPKDASEYSDDLKKSLATYQTETGKTPEMESLEKTKKQLAGIKPINTPIMRQLPKEKLRETRIQVRGNFKVLGDVVEPGVPAVFHSLPADQPVDRLSFARWLVDSRNPLTARVVVNRYWEHLFGNGIVETVEDFGSQGELPSHPELLDYLAFELIEHGWDTKWLLKEIVTSRTYCQTSRETEALVALDPNNRLLARGPRFRLPAEMIRDQALAVSGLLSYKMLGPSVRPFQPKLGIKAAFGGTTDWEPSPGEDKYRRGLYTTWRRTSPYPSMVTFDAPSREVCTIRRIRTNTPLQALVTLNDPVYIEAAQALARLTMQENSDDQERIKFAFRRTLIRPPTDRETDVLTRTLRQVRSQLADEKEEAVKLATMPLGPLDESIDPVEAAAWTVISNVLLNLDETLARP